MRACWIGCNPRGARQPLDRRDRPAGNVDERGLAGERRRAVEEHRAGSALAFAAARLRAGQAELLTQVREQVASWGVAEFTGVPVDRGGGHRVVTGAARSCARFCSSSRADGRSRGTTLRFRWRSRGRRAGGPSDPFDDEQEPQQRRVGERSTGRHEVRAEILRARRRRPGSAANLLSPGSGRASRGLNEAGQRRRWCHGRERPLHRPQRLEPSTEGSRFGGARRETRQPGGILDPAPCGARAFHPRRWPRRTGRAHGASPVPARRPSAVQPTLRRSPIPRELQNLDQIKAFR